MADHMFLRPSGILEWRPDATTRPRVTAAGAYIIARGQLCTACLVGSTPMTLLKMNRTLCDLCANLEAEATRRAGLSGKSAGQWQDSVIVVDETASSTADDPGQEPVRRARAYRERRLETVFVRARALGVVVLEEGSPGQSPAELVDVNDLDAHGLIPKSLEDRVTRYVQWLADLDPEGYALRADELADVDRLATWLREFDHRIRRAHARAELDRAVRQAAKAPRALANGAVGVIRARRRIK